jgi:hypothetical protein
VSLRAVPRLARREAGEETNEGDEGGLGRAACGTDRIRPAAGRRRLGGFAGGAAGMGLVAHVLLLDLSCLGSRRHQPAPSTGFISHTTCDSATEKGMADSGC